MTKHDFDLIVIGAGSGGVRASRLAAGLGVKVAVVEESRVGGTCVIRGCVPKKLLVYSSHFAEDFQDAVGYGWSIEKPDFDWHRLISAKNAEIDRLNGIYLNMLRNAGVTLLPGRGVITGAHTVEVDGKSYSTERILVATGARPALPPIPGIEYAITSNEALDLMNLPRRMVIVGGGYIAIEFASIFNNLGVEVIQLIRGDSLLRGFDKDLRVEATELALAKGIDLRIKTNVGSIEKKPGRYFVHLKDGSSLETDLVFYATGRRPNTGNLGLESVGITPTASGAIAVDSHYCTSVPSIFAIGDVIDKMALTPVALAEGTVFVNSVYKNTPTSIDYDIVPSAVFSQPPMASVGLTEDKAQERGKPFQVYESRFRPMRNILAERDEKTYLKVIVDTASRKVLGCHMIGPDAPEIIQGLGIALTCGATKEQFDATIGVHPSLAEEFVTLRTPRAET